MSEPISIDIALIKFACRLDDIDRANGQKLAAWYADGASILPVANVAPRMPCSATLIAALSCPIRRGAK